MARQIAGERKERGAQVVNVAVERTRRPARWGGRLAGRRLTLLAGWAIGAVATATAGAQSTRSTPATDTTRSAAVPVSGVLLDAPVSRTTYRLGPGDMLDIGLLGELTRVYTVSVTPEGSILVPGVGVVRVLGLTLDAAERQVRALLLRFYRNVEVTLSLAQVRSFKMFVLGNVVTPGVRTATAATRVSEVVPPSATLPHRRNILLRRANGDSLSLDLARFLQTGDLSANPMLREGDALIVPIVDRTVSVVGRVSVPGTYEYRPGESLADLLFIANAAGPFPSDAADSVRLVRFVGRDQREFRVFTREQALGAEGRAFTLQPFDAIFVSQVANYKVQKTATVTGQVVRPGTYPIRPETTTVRELVGMAGGLTPDASLVEATLRRLPQTTEVQQARQLQAIPVELLTDDERRILQTRNQSDPTAVVIDFTQLFVEGKQAYDQPLESGDVLTVPVRRNGVTVLGAVSQPGIVQYVPGKGLDYYVELAGGYGRQADRGARTVLKARLGNRVDPRDVSALDPGDQIIIPFREPTQYLRRLQSAVTTAAGLIVSFYTLRQLFRGN